MPIKISKLNIGFNQIIIKIVLSFDDISTSAKRALLTLIYFIISARKKGLAVGFPQCAVIIAYVNRDSTSKL